MLDENWVIIGLGNEFMRDDGLGIYALREIRKRIEANGPDEVPDKGASSHNIILRESTVGGLELLDCLVGYQNCILLDAVVTGKYPVGTVYRHIYHYNDEPVRLITSHQINLTELLGFAKLYQTVVPSSIIIYGMEAADVMTFSPGCTAAVKEKLPVLVDEVMKELNSYRKSPVSLHGDLAEFPRWPSVGTIPTDDHRICILQKAE